MIVASLYVQYQACLVIPYPTGVIYETTLKDGVATPKQCEGFLVPIGIVPVSNPICLLSKSLCGALSPEDVFIREADAATMDDIFELDRIPLRVDRARLRESFFGWTYVRVLPEFPWVSPEQERSGILYWGRVIPEPHGRTKRRLRKLQERREREAREAQAYDEGI